MLDRRKIEAADRLDRREAALGGRRRRRDGSGLVRIGSPIISDPRAAGLFPAAAILAAFGALTGIDADRRHRARQPLLHRVAHVGRSEEHTSELQSLMRNSYAAF